MWVWQYGNDVVKGVLVGYSLREVKASGKSRRNEKMQEEHLYQWHDVWSTECLGVLK
jgi:hypothetical protein